MCKIWNFVKRIVPQDGIRIKLFLLLNIVSWFALFFVIVLVLESLLAPITMKVLENVLLAAGYAGVFPGFFGGCIYLMRNT